MAASQRVHFCLTALNSSMQIALLLSPRLKALATSNQHIVKERLNLRATWTTFRYKSQAWRRLREWDEAYLQKSAMSTTDQTNTPEQSTPPEAPAGDASNATGPDRGTGHHIFVALETPNHRYWVHQYHLSGSVPDQMAAFKEWYQRATGKRHAFAAFMLCKKPYISIDRLEVPSHRGVKLRP